MHSNSDFSTWITSLYCSMPSSEIFAWKPVTFGPKYKSLWVPDLTCRFVHAKRRDLHQNDKFTWVQPSSVVLWLQNSDFKTRLTSLYGSQSSSVVLSTHNSVLSTRIKRLYGFQPSPVVLSMQNSDFRTRITCLYGSQTSPVIFCLLNSLPSIRITSLYGSQPSSVIFACKTATFGPE